MRRSTLAVVAALVVAGSVVLAPPPVASAAPCAASDQHVAMVVDFGDGVTVTSTCVPVASDANGVAALYARAALLGTKAPVVRSSGFVCAIDGYPSQGCADPAGNGTFAYWSYWHGTGGTWSYSDRGASSRVQPDVVEGWRYLPNGRDSPDMPPPGGSADAATTCVAPPPTTTATAAAPALDPTAPVAGGGATPAASTGTAPARSPITSAAGAPATTAVTADASTTTTSVTSVSSGASDRAAPVVTVGAGGGAGGSGSPLGILAGIGAVGALVGGGAVVLRRRAGIR